MPVINNEKKLVSGLLMLTLSLGLVIQPIAGKSVFAQPIQQADPSALTLMNASPGIQSPINLSVADMIAPHIELTTLASSKSVALAGDSVTIRVKVSDENTGIQKVSFTLDNENGGHRKVELTRPDVDGYYSVNFTVDSNTHDGLWYLSFLEALDNNGNLTFYSSSETDLSNGSFRVTNPTADMTAPVAQISTLKVSRTQAVPGESVRIGIMASDEKTSVASVQYFLINENSASKTLTTKTKSSDGFFYADFLISTSTHSGKWMVQDIKVTDVNGNYRSYSNYDVDMAKGQFAVTNDQADMTPPFIDLSTLYISRRIAYPGETVRLKVKASDEQSGIKSVDFDLVNENGGLFTMDDLSPDSNGYYSFDFYVYDTTHLGEWRLTGIQATDKNDNFSGYWESDADLSQATFYVNESDLSENPIPAISITRDTTWNYKIIDGDVYVAPNVHLTMGDVTINGNLYILGSAESRFRLQADTVYAKSSYTGTTVSKSNGALSIVSGTTAFKLMKSDQPIPSIPIRVTSENQVTNQGILPSLDGTTLPIGDLYVDGQKVSYNYNGTFSLSNIQAGSKSSIQLKVIDVFGKTHITEHLLDNPLLIPSVTTIAGNDRYETAALISQASYPEAETAILVQALDFPDALSAGPLAYQMKAPILLTGANTLHPTTEKELKRLNVKKVVIMGGTSAIDQTVEDAVKSLSMEVERISGANRYETAVNAAVRLKELNGQNSTAVLAAGLNFPDALAAGSFAARYGYPILLTQKLSVTHETVDYLAASGVNNVIIIGLDQVISVNVENELKSKGISVTRVGGLNRADTSRIIAEKYFDGSYNAFAASGFSFADGLAAAPYAAGLNAPVLLVSESRVDDRVIEYLIGSAVRSITVVGGTSAVGQSVKDVLLDAIN